MKNVLLRSARLDGGRNHTLPALPTRLPASVCAFRGSEVPSVQLRVRHQMGVQQALEEQARPEAGGERRRAQVGGNFLELGIDLDVSQHTRAKQTSPGIGLGELLLGALGFLVGKLRRLFKSSVTLRGIMG